MNKKINYIRKCFSNNKIKIENAKNSINLNWKYNII